MVKGTDLPLSRDQRAQSTQGLVLPVPKVPALVSHVIFPSSSKPDSTPWTEGSEVTFEQVLNFSEIEAENNIFRVQLRLRSQHMEVHGNKFGNQRVTGVGRAREAHKDFSGLELFSKVKQREKGLLAQGNTHGGLDEELVCVVKIERRPS